MGKTPKDSFSGTWPVIGQGKRAWSAMEYAQTLSPIFLKGMILKLKMQDGKGTISTAMAGLG